MNVIQTLEAKAAAIRAAAEKDAQAVEADVASLKAKAAAGEAEALAVIEWPIEKAREVFGFLKAHL